MLATRLGLALGLPLPRVEVIEVSEWLIVDTPDLRIQLAGAEIPCQSGPQLASLYIGPLGIGCGGSACQHQKTPPRNILAENGHESTYNGPHAAAASC